MYLLIFLVSLLFVYWMCCFFVVFFFSSRRRHTRCLSDWSSDVCSSDLESERTRRKKRVKTSSGESRWNSACSASASAARAGRMSTSAPFLSVTVRSSDRKSTRLNSSHLGISYAVFCLKKKKKHI